MRKEYWPFFQSVSNLDFIGEHSTNAVFKVREIKFGRKHLWWKRILQNRNCWKEGSTATDMFEIANVHTKFMFRPFLFWVFPTTFLFIYLILSFQIFLKNRYLMPLVSCSWYFDNGNWSNFNITWTSHEIVTDSTRAVPRSAQKHK